MKVQIFNWASAIQVTRDIEDLGYSHCQIIEGDVFEIAKKFVERGNNIMIMKGDSVECDFVLGIDTHAFGQR